MKLLALIGLCFLAIVLAQRPILSLEPDDWLTNPFFDLYSFFLWADADLFYYLDESAADFTSTLVIRRRNNNGEYNYVANVTTNQFPVNSNGKWMVLADHGVTLFSINENNDLSNFSGIPTIDFGYILSDDTFVGYDPIPNKDGTYTIRSFQYNASNNTWINIPGTDLIIDKQARMVDGKISNLRVTDDSLVVWGSRNVSNNATLDIYKRQADKSWSFVERVPTSLLYMQEGQIDQIFYNGVDSVAISIVGTLSPSNTTGFVYIYTKINGKWIEQFISPDDVGYRPLAFFGLWIEFSDSNTMFISAGYEGITFSKNESMDNTGKVLMLARNTEGTWIPKRDLIGEFPAFGIGLAVNDYDLFVASYGNETVAVYTIQSCIFQPINVTCNDKQANDCSEVPVTDLYTIHNAQCGNVTATVNGRSLSDDHVLQVQLQFDRTFVATAYCNATVTCPAPVIPVAPVAPIASQVPVQNTPAKVSNATAMLINTLLLIIFVAIL